MVSVIIGFIVGWVAIGIARYLRIKEMHKRCVYDPKTKCWRERF